MVYWSFMFLAIYQLLLLESALWCILTGNASERCHARLLCRGGSFLYA